MLVLCMTVFLMRWKQAKWVTMLFALIYRPDDPYADLAKAIEFIYDNADELQINSNEYSLGRIGRCKNGCNSRKF